MSSEDADSSSTMTASACASQDEPSCEQAEEPAKPAASQETGSAAGDVATQSLLLALIAQPIVQTDTQQPAKAASAELDTTAVESVMPPVTEDGTSLPVTAADSSNVPQTGNTVETAKPADLTAVVPSQVMLHTTVDTKAQAVVPPDKDPMLSSQVQPAPDTISETGPDKQEDSPKQVVQSNDPVQAAAKSEPVIPPKAQPLQTTDTQENVTPVATQQVQRPEDNRPVAAEHPAQLREAPRPKEDADPKPMSAVTTGSQESTNQDRSSNMESSGEDRRERATPEPIAPYAPRTETSAPASPSHSSLLTNTVDQRAFTSAPSAKLPADASPSVTTPPVQPTDWMPGASTNQTKSMVLELSQADLGRVNIRVAVNQDVVHTHFSSDRTDMSQYLQNGQERLQSALQSSGLDLGRFQVDIDRQSAGRSFQQSASQGQSHGRSPHEESHNQGQGREEFTREPSSRRGKLNLVA